LADEHLLDPDIIVFGPIKSTEAPYRPDDEKSDTYVFIDQGGTAVSSPSRTRRCSRVQRGILRQMTASRLKYRDIKIEHAFRCRQFDHSVISKFEDRISRQRPAILL